MLQADNLPVPDIPGDHSVPNTDCLPLRGITLITIHSYMSKPLEVDARH